jgi:O-methyltransferase involved in polyketide biosynthesis
LVLSQNKRSELWKHDVSEFVFEQGGARTVEKLPPEELRGVSETLLIPLHYRVEESRNQASTFRDEIGERFHDAIAYDWRKFKVGSFYSRMMAVRTAILDEQAGRFLGGAPDGLVVNLGAGLDTRFYRLDNGIVHWIELDLPSVISFRGRLQEPTNERHRLIAGSVLEDGWVAEAKQDARARILFIAEGLLPYFTEEEHRKIFGYLVKHFPGQEMLFQTMAPSLIQGLVQYSNLSRMSTNVDLRWGLDDSTQVSALLNPKVRFIREFPLLEGRYDLLPDPIKQKLSPAAAVKVGKIVHVQFDK